MVSPKHTPSPTPRPPTPRPPTPRPPTPKHTLDGVAITHAEEEAAARVKKTIDEYIILAYKQLLEIGSYIKQRDLYKKKTNEKEKSIYDIFFNVSSIDFFNGAYTKFLDICDNPGVKTLLEYYAMRSRPKQLVYKLTATVQAHSAEYPRIKLLNNNVLTLSFSGRPGQSGIMAPAQIIGDSGQMPILAMNTRTKIEEILDFGTRKCPKLLNLFWRTPPIAYGIDFWLSWYLNQVGSLYEKPTYEAISLMLDEYMNLKSKLGKDKIKHIVRSAMMQPMIMNTANPSTNLYKLRHRLIAAWGFANITFPGGGFKVICVNHEHEHSLKPNEGEDPDLCPCYGISVVETTNPADLEFTNKGLPFLKGLKTKASDADSVQAYIKQPHLIDGANFAPMPDKMLENVRATHDMRRTTTGANVNLLDQQLYWLNKILVFCEDSVYQMVYYALLFLEMCVNRKTCHSAMVNMVQQGMGYILTCIDPTCRYISELEEDDKDIPGSKLIKAALQIVEYKDDLRVVEKIVATQETQSELCHYVKKTSNDGGICSKPDAKEVDRVVREINKYEQALENALIDDQSRDIDKRMFATLETTDRLYEYIQTHNEVFKRISKLFHHPPPDPKRSSHSPSLKTLKRSNHSPPSSGGKMSSTRKRMISVRRILGRKNKRCIRYTKKIKIKGVIYKKTPFK